MSDVGIEDDIVRVSSASCSHVTALANSNALVAHRRVAPEQYLRARQGPHRLLSFAAQSQHNNNNNNTAMNGDDAAPRGLSPVSGSRPTTSRTSPTNQNAVMRGSQTVRLSEQEKEELFVKLYHSSKKDFRTSRGALHQRIISVRPPPPRSVAEIRRGHEIQRENIDAVRSPTRLLGSRTEKCRPPSPVARVPKERLHRVAVQTSSFLEEKRHHIDDKYKRMETIDTNELRKKAFGLQEETEELVLRLCAWHVTVAVMSIHASLNAIMTDTIEKRHAQTKAFQRATMTLIKNLLPSTRRWARRRRLRHLFRWLFCGLFLVKMRRFLRQRSCGKLCAFLRVVSKDRVIALKKFSKVVRRSLQLVEKSYRCRKALREVLELQWETMETSVLMMHQGLLPELVQLSAIGWKDESAPIRLKLQHTAAQLPPLQEDPDWEDAPSYLIDTLKWRSFFKKYRPVGMFDLTPNHVPRCLDVIRVLVDVRQNCIEEYLDAEYSYLRHKILDQRVAARARLRNLEEWRERQIREVSNYVAGRFPNIHKTSRMFEIVRDFETERRNTYLQIDPSMRRMYRNGSIAVGSQQQKGQRCRLMEEHALREMVVKCLRERIQSIITQPSRLEERRATVVLAGGYFVGAVLARKESGGALLRKESTMALMERERQMQEEEAKEKQSSAAQSTAMTPLHPSSGVAFEGEVPHEGKGHDPLVPTTKTDQANHEDERAARQEVH